jgi:hypothetical protein
MAACARASGRSHGQLDDAAECLGLGLANDLHEFSTLSGDVPAIVCRHNSGVRLSPSVHVNYVFEIRTEVEEGRDSRK